MARMEQELARIQRDPQALSAVLMFDLDLFKDINDTHGHAKGDDVLKHFAQVLLCELRKVDSVGRIGGEEFAIMLSGAEFRLLRVFLEHPNRVLNRDQLLNLTQGRDADPFDRSVDIQISRLRQKLGEDARLPQIIKTVRNGGYVLAGQVTVEPAA